jgi:hypothetical protein
MEHKRRRITVIALLLCLPTLLLAVPAAGLRLDSLRLNRVGLPSGPELAAKGRGHGQIWTTSVKISARVTKPISPGVSWPVTLTFSNQNPKVVGMKRVRVKIESISAPHADATHPCTRLDFQIRQMPRRSLWIPAHQVTDLAGLGVPVESWPTLGMRNRPLNQDGCKGAQLTLRLRSARLDTRSDQ